MRILLVGLIVATITSAAFAQAPMAGMTPEQMQQMAKEMQKNAGKLEACFSQINQKQMEALQIRGQKMQAQVKALCDTGQRDEAMAAAIRFGHQMQNDPEIQKARKCGEIMKNTMPNMQQYFINPKELAAENKHICDG